MTIKETSTGVVFEVEIVPVEEAEFVDLNEKRYFFDWKAEQKYEVFKLRKVVSTDILGLISLESIPNEWRVHIRLLTVSIENKGKDKKYEGIAGNLIAHAAVIAVRDYAELACVSLRPKNHIAQHYINKYNMRKTGVTLSIEVPEILDLIKNYNHDK